MALNSVVTSIREWWRPRHQYLPLSDSPDRQSPPTVKKGRGRLYKAILLFSLFFNAIMLYFTFYAFRRPSVDASVSDVCPAPLPNLFSADPPSPLHPLIQEATTSFQSELATYFKESDLDSVAIAVVTPQESLFEAFHGPLRANESSSIPVDRDSIYRIASISKLFTALETFILRERGALNLDDPVSMFVPEMRKLKTPNARRITIRQLLSHMSGVGRDWPPGDATGNWPETLDGSGPSPYSDKPMPNRTTLLKALDENVWIADPYTYPVYTNAGYNLLGLVNRLADASHEKRSSPLSHEALIERDIFRPLRFTGSSFLVNDKDRHRTAVSSSEAWETDVDFGETNPGGGQFSSLSDLILLAQSMLNPSGESSLLPPDVMREWLRTIHDEWDGFSAVGMLWEIFTLKYSSDKTITLYQKGGDLNSHHAIFALLPVRSAAVVVLTTGKTGLANNLTKLATKHFMPVFDTILATKVKEQLGGRWVSKDGATTLELEVENGSLHAVDFHINGTDALATLQTSPTKKMAVWYMGKNDEYRLSPSRAPENGCMFQWVNLDDFAYANHAPVNLFRLIKDPNDAAANILHIPSIQLNLTR